jgi:hypothetical protein
MNLRFISRNLQESFRRTKRGKNYLRSKQLSKIGINLASDLLSKLGCKQVTKAKLLEIIEADFSLLPTLFEGTLSSKATIRYGCGSVLVDLSEKHPNKVYPYVTNFVSLLDSKYRILSWNAMAAIANLTAVDGNHKFDVMFDKYYSFLGSEYMVTVANVVANSSKIAANKPYLGNRIATELLKVRNLQTTPHLTEECKLVIAEQTIQTFNTLINYTQNKKALIEFAQMYQDSPRISLRKEAQKFLKKWQ